MKSVSLIQLAKRGLGELALIFLGITLALMFENWNADRERKRQELNLLAELYLDLEETQSDLERDIASNERGLQNGRLMLEAFNGAAVGADEFGEAFASGIVRGRLVAKTSSYESIKTIGLDLIENNDLRKRIADVHELYLARVLADQAEVDSELQLYWQYGRALFFFPQSVEFSSALRSQAVDFAFDSASTESLRPVDYGAVLGDHGLRIALVRLFNQAAEIQARYMSLDDAITQAQEQIEAELTAYGRAL